MSVATELPPQVYIPAAARPRVLRAVPYSVPAVPSPASSSPHPVAPAAAAIGAEVTDLDRWRHHTVGAQASVRRRDAAGLRTRLEAPGARSASAPVRLTHRGLVVIGVASVLVALAVVLGAWLSAGGAASSSATSNGQLGQSTPSVITVHQGDSLWAIATTVAPNRDPRVVVAQLRKLNHLSGETVTPGQQLRVR